MKQSNAAAATSGTVAPYQLIPDYVFGMVLPDIISLLYCRLSRDDRDKEKKDDSNSIVNQKKILGKYAMDNNLPNPVFFVDDGISGTTFDRPNFKSAIALVEAGKVKNFVVKDMSRFGRDYIQVGLYTEMMFPDNGVRFVALYDNVDSDKGADDLTPFRNIMNEWYARDTSKKVRAVFQAKGMAGEPMGSNAVYGLLKNPNDKKRRIIDEEAAPVIQQIFRDFLSGLGKTHIAAKLREAKIECPEYHAIRIGAIRAKQLPEDPYAWHPKSIAHILVRLEYLGHTANFKTHRKSYKHRKKLDNDPSEFVIFENTHEAIIDQETFDRVQQLLKTGKRRRASSGRLCIFSGLTYCADCGSRMYLSCGSCLKPEQDNFVCSGFRTKKRDCNSAHFIRRVVLERLVLEQIQTVTAYAAQYEHAFAEMLHKDSDIKNRKELVAQKRKLTQAENRIVELDNIVQRLYEDNVSGKLTDERFIKLSRGYEQEQADLSAETEALAQKIAAQEQQTVDLSRFLAQVRKYTCVEELTPILLNELVERIEVHAPDKSSGRRTQQVDVRFNFVGVIGKLDFLKSDKPILLVETEAGQPKASQEK